MTKTKWHSKLLSLSIAFALVFSLVAMVVPVKTVEAQTDPELSVSVSVDPQPVYCCCDVFNVTATIQEAVGGSANATGVNATLTITGNAEIGLDTGVKTNTISVGNVTANSTEIVTWEVHCTGKDTVVPTRFTVEVEYNEGSPVSDYAEVVQESGWLKATIIAPEYDDIFSVCSEFDVVFYIENTGCNSVRTIFAEVKTIEGAEIVGGGMEKDVYIGRLEAYERSGNYTVRVHCTTVGPAIIHVDPIGEDVCSGEEIEGDSALVEVEQVFGVTCNVTPDPTKVCHNVTFAALVGDGAEYDVSYNWTFGDGNWTAGTSSDPLIEVQHHYASPGNYTAVVEVTDKTPRTVTCNTTVVVYSPLSVACGVSYNQTKVCHNVTLYGDIIGGIPQPPAAYNWTWEFGDGESESGSCTSVDNDPGDPDISVDHHYAVNGTFNATLTIWDNYDPLFNEATCNVTVEVFPPLGVSCNATPLETKVGHAVNFTAERIGGLPVPPTTYTWSWNFGDGIGSSSSQNSTYTYNTPGNWTATVTLSDGHEAYNNTATCNVTIVVHRALNVTCNVTPDPQNVCHAVNFTAERDGGVPGNSYNWTWEFDDGTTAVGQNVSKTFMCVGNYTGTVTVKDLDLGNEASCNATVEIIIEAPELYTPINRAQLTSKNVTFTWEDIGCCDYILEVCQKDGLEIKVLRVDTGKDAFWTGPIYNGEWKWQVTATDACGNSATSDTWFFRVDQPETSVTVNSPNGGEVWAPGSEQSITWFATPTDGVIDLYLSSDGGGSWDLIQSGEDNDGAYPWTVPAISSEQCMVKVVITDAATGTAEDTSDNLFTIGTPTTELAVEVDAPEQINEGESYFVTAVVSNVGTEAADNVTATLEINGNAALAAGTLSQTIGDMAVGESQAVEWEVQCTGAGGVNLVVSADGNNTVPASGSAAVQQIAITAELAVEVDAPEQINEGESYFVTAVVSNVGTEAADNVTATLEINGNAALAAGTLSQTIGDIAVGESQAVEWEVQCTGAGGVNLVVSADGNNTVPASGSAAVLQIADEIYPDVSVEYPNGGEGLVAGTSVTITWSASDFWPMNGYGASQSDDLDIDLDYSTDGGNSWISIATGEDNDGAYLWSIPSGIDSTNCLVKVDATDLAGNVGSDTSDGEFSIVPPSDTTDPTVTVTSPDGGESYAGGSSQAITWTAADNVAVTAVDLYLSSNGGTDWAVIALGESNDGTYTWTLPAINSDQCLVKAVAFDAAGNSAEDVSNAVFTIATDSNAPVVTVNRPDGGETFAGNSQEFILWNATDDVSAQGDISIDLYYKVGTGSWILIATGEDNDGAYKWTVPTINSSQVLVKVEATDEAGNVGSDDSDNEFTIVTVVVAIPDAGASVNGTVIVPITITGVTDMASVDVWLSYGTGVVNVVAVTAGDLGAVTSSIDNTTGVTKINWFSGTGSTGDFIIANVELKAVGTVGETSNLGIEVKSLTDPDANPIPVSEEDGLFTVLALMEGDVTLNGHVTIADAMFIAQYMATLRSLNADQLEAADTYDDTVVSIADASHIAQWLVDPNGTLGILAVPLWASPADDHMLVPVP